MNPIRCPTCGEPLAWSLPDGSALILGATRVQHKVTLGCRICESRGVPPHQSQRTFWPSPKRKVAVKTDA